MSCKYPLSVCFGSSSKETKEWRGLQGEKKKENEVDFTLEECSGEFYNFVVNFLPHSCVHNTVLQNLCKNQKCKLLYRTKTSFSSASLSNQNITIRMILNLRD